jgi:hypothetical protein
VARRYDDVVVAIRDLLEQNGTQLIVTSPLHKLPYYLQHRLTLADAFHTLDLLRLHGDQAKRSLAALCADVLERVHQELRLYQQLQAIYQVVAGAPSTTGPEEVRRRSMLEFRRLFAGTRHRIVGFERLPERPGHIVIMNHLDNPARGTTRRDTPHPPSASSPPGRHRHSASIARGRSHVPFTAPLLARHRRVWLSAGRRRRHGAVSPVAWPGLTVWRLDQDASVRT